MRRLSFKRAALYGLIALVALFAVLQAIPYGRDHDNPPARAEPPWDSEQTRRLAVDSCFACHSNETKWPWYSNIAPMSWLVYRDVRDGREALNLSEWDRPQEEAGEAAEVVREGEMPPRLYTLVNRSAKLSSEEKEALAGGLEATLGQGGRDGEED